MGDPERTSARDTAEPGALSAPAQHRHKKQSWRLPRRFKLIDRASRQPEELEAGEKAIARQHCKAWYMCRGKVPPPPPLHPAVNQLITEWFDAVDADGSRTLEPNELKAALKAAGIPCNELTIAEMIRLMDVNRDGVISWDEFHLFMASEFQNGKSLMEGEYILPSGTTLNFGVMIAKLRRDKLIKEVLEDRSRRGRWAEVAASPRQLAKQLTTMLQASQVAEKIKCAQEEAVDDSHAHNPRSEAVAKILDSLAAEARIMRSISRQASRLQGAASRRQSSCNPVKGLEPASGRCSPIHFSLDRDVASRSRRSTSHGALCEEDEVCAHRLRGLGYPDVSISSSLPLHLPSLGNTRHDASHTDCGPYPRYHQVKHKQHSAYRMPQKAGGSGTVKVATTDWGQGHTVNFKTPSLSSNMTVVAAAVPSVT